MTFFAPRPDRAGVRFWLPVLSVIGMGSGLAIWIAASLQSSGDPGMLRGVRGEVIALLLGGMGASAGVIVGVLNRWVASRTAAAIVGAVAVYPSVAAFGYYRYGGAHPVPRIALVALVLSALLGGMYGLIHYDE